MYAQKKEKFRLKEMSPYSKHLRRKFLLKGILPSVSLACSHWF